MTLVAGLSVGGLPAFIGDLLISWRVPSTVDLPTHHKKEAHASLSGDYAAGLAQKLIIVRPYLLIAWAGQRADVDRMIHELDRILPSEVSDLKGPEVILDVLDTCGADSELVALLIYAERIYPFGVRTCGFELDDKRVYLLGSGASEFFEYLQMHPEILPNQKQVSDLVAQAIMIRFAGRALALQYKINAGLEGSWGGGFEIAYPRRSGFQKIGDIMFRAWMIDEDGKYHNSGRSFFLRYYGRDLHLNWFNPGEKTYVIRSPIGKPHEVPDDELVSPEWTVDTFFMKRDGSFVEYARYQPTWKPVVDKIQMKNGSLVSWAMDRDYVENCVKAALNVTGMDNRFHIIRY